MRQENINIIPLQTATTVSSAAIPAMQLFYCSAQITVTSGGGGTLVLQASNDNFDSSFTDPAAQLPVNWSPIPSASVTVTGAGSFLIPKTDLCYQYVRLVYTNTGTGTINVTFKSLGD